MNAADLLEKEQSQTNYTTMSSSFDKLLSGIPSGALVEVAGFPGMGKTQLAMQLCVSIHLSDPKASAIYIDTEGSFVPSRLAQMAAAVSPGDVEAILSNVHVYRITSQLDLLALLNLLEEYIMDDPTIKLVIIDSIAFPFRNSTDMAHRSRTLHTMAQILRKIASLYGVCVLITNQMTTKIIQKVTGESSSIMIPALGESWGHACMHRIVLLWKNETRIAWLSKSSTRANKQQPFTVTVI